MEPSSAPTASMESTGRRKSGRTIQKRELYQPESSTTARGNGSAKRKRVVAVVDDAEAEELDESDEEEEEDSDPDEEELKDKRRAAARAKLATTRPAAKKPKTTAGKTIDLAMRPATNGARKGAKGRKSRVVAGAEPDVDHGKLYRDIFSSSLHPDEAASTWLQSYDADASGAMRDLVNFVLECTGCSLKVDEDDINDPDNVTGKLSDLQEEYQAQNITEYPLVSKGGAHSFRPLLVAFFESMIQTAHAAGTLYSEAVLIENIQVWVTTMTSSAIRPFRHTATVIALAIAYATCNITKDILSSTAITMKQKESEEKKKTVNKGRVATLKANIDEDEKKREFAEALLKDIFDTVFVHRYRDVDPKIRVECTVAIGTWISTCPDMFFEGQYLRYLGWLLSDVAAPTRAEVVKQLLQLYTHTENATRLRAFTERFRPRMVEMASLDAEPAIRASVVELLGMLRELGFLEPDDIDSIGKLIFDTEARVRKAVAGFFVEHVNDVLETAIEELGEESLDEVVGDEVEDDYDTPRKSWLKLKCLAELLDAYDDDEEEAATEHAQLEISTGTDSRYSMAARVIYDRMPEIQNWEILAGYLLSDTSCSPAQSRTKDTLTRFKSRCQLSEKQEVLLLEILRLSVKQRLTKAIEGETDRKGRKLKAKKEESREIQETTALQLARIIPRLLRKFGANPATASAVLRLEPILDLDIFQELRQDSTEYAALLDDINKQFLTHADGQVLVEASSALLHARSCPDLEEVTDGKVQELWDDTARALRQSMRSRARVVELADTVDRIATLARVADCAAVFEAPGPRPAKGSSTVDHSKIYDVLLQLLRDHGPSLNSAESDRLTNATMQALLFYWMWVASNLRHTLASGDSISSARPLYGDFYAALRAVISSRPKLDEVRLNAIGAFLDGHTVFATIRQFARPHEADSEMPSEAHHFFRVVEPEEEDLMLASFVAAEKAFARKAKRNLEGPDDDDPPEDADSEPEEDSEAEDAAEDDEKTRHMPLKQQELLMAERRLCELTGKLVLAMLGGVLDASGPRRGMLRKRLQRNKAKLCASFKEVLNYLDEPKTKRASKAKAQEQRATSGVAAEKGSAPTADQGDDGDEIEEVEDGGEDEGGEEDLRRLELADDIEDPDEAPDGHEATAGPPAPSDDIDDIMGD